MKTQTYNLNKMKEMIVYIADRSALDDRFGATKLNKILFYADFIAYKELGKPITGSPYQRLRNGPAPVKLLPAQDALVMEGRVSVETRAFHGWTQKVTKAKTPANLKEFSEPELQIVNDVIESLWKETATGVSDMSHEFIGWKLARNGEEIPYCVALVKAPDPTDALVSRAREVANTEAAKRIFAKHRENAACR